MRWLCKFPEIHSPHPIISTTHDCVWRKIISIGQSTMEVLWLLLLGKFEANWVSDTDFKSSFKYRIWVQRRARETVPPVLLGSSVRYVAIIIDASRVSRAPAKWKWSTANYRTSTVSYGVTEWIISMAYILHICLQNSKKHLIMDTALDPPYKSARPMSCCSSWTKRTTPLKCSLSW